MNERLMGDILSILYISLVPLLIGVCIYNSITAKKKERAAAPYVLLPVGLGVVSFFGLALLVTSFDLFSVNFEFVVSLLIFLLILCGFAFSVLVAKRALNKEDKRRQILSRSLKPEHFTNGRSFSRAAFEDWIFESRKCAKKALMAYICSVGGGILLSLLFSNGVGGASGNIMSVLCIFAGLIFGGVFSKKAGRSAENAAAYLGISSIEVTSARQNLKSGTLAWSDEEPAKPAGDDETRITEAESNTEISQEAAQEKPVDFQKKGKRPRGKMKKWLKVTLVSVAGVIVLFVSLVVISIIENNIRDKNAIALRHCLYACDVEGAQEYAKKLTTKTDTTYQDMADRMERFLVQYNAGNWREAIAEYDGGNRFVDEGIALARYCECYYQMLIPPAETALDEGRIRDAIELLLQFQNRFYWLSKYDFDTETHLGSFPDYTEYFGDHSQNYLDLTARAAEAAMAAGDKDVISLLEGFRSHEMKTVPFADFSWSEEYLAWEATQ